MATALTNITAAPAGAAIAGFRMGEDHLSGSSDSDSDQSAHSERSLSPSRIKKSKTKKRKERKQVGELSEELETLLGGAFQTSNGDAAATGDAGQVTADPPTDVVMTPAQQKLSKRTRQNMAKMEKRKAHHKRWLDDRAARQDLAPKLDGKQNGRQKGARKRAAEVRREKKDRQRAKKSAAKDDAMEIA
ncbi:hypothetical protein CC86DRAFT_366152 [Ophiobolus disseminans]|uniref:Uncharacterized protein n=1 Tax=Ophiobolus disseminans TaxID=1469910 RepID=A0A6A7AGR1_9PLEO|nr:hypothetical protein CC86DRAFT_366152 [Ophiobolus disseminans]